MPEVEVQPLPADQWWLGAGVAARALQSNPTFVWMLGDDPLHRVESMHRLLLDSPAPMVGTAVGAWRGSLLLGVAAMTPSSHCLGSPSVPEAMRQAPPGPVGAPASPDRYQRVFATIAAHDPTEPHWHVAPVGVEPGFQGLGVGAAMMRRLVARLDVDQQLAWLETDRPENVRFYAAYGFEPVATDDTYGYTTWFLSRPPPPR